MLAPRELFLTKIEGTLLQMRLNHIPGAGIQWGLCIAGARNTRPEWGWGGALMLGTAWFAVLQAAYLVHTVGHILSAKQANAPMDAAILEYGRVTNVYHNNAVTPEQHIQRAAGGPIANAATGLSALPFWVILRRVPVVGDLLAVFTVGNLAGAAFSMLPISAIDGGTLIRQSYTAAYGDRALGKEALQQSGVLGLVVFAVSGVLVWLLPVRYKAGRSAVLLTLAGLHYLTLFGIPFGGLSSSSRKLDGKKH